MGTSARRERGPWKMARSLSQALGLAGVWVVVGCSSGAADRIAEDYCDYIREAEEMDFEQRQEAITDLDRRLLESEIPQDRVRASIRRQCPRALVDHEGRMLGVLGRELKEMRREIEELR